MSEQQAAFEGWAILEIFGHQTFAGYVKTEYYGGDAMFRLDVPPLPEREHVTRSGCYVENGSPDLRRWVNAGATIKAVATEGYTKLFGVKALYSMTPCTQEAALKAVESIQPRALMLVSLPPEKAIAQAAEPIERGFTCCDGNPEEGHSDGCPNQEFDGDADEVL
jgi:hypothetical protein